MLPISSCRILVPPSSLVHLALPFQVGIQVASEDLCSEKQWCVCKALATFVAHRELSKVGEGSMALYAARPPGCLSRAVILEVGRVVEMKVQQGIHSFQKKAHPPLWLNPKCLPALLFPFSPRVPHCRILQVFPLPSMSCLDILHPRFLCPRMGSGDTGG